MTSPGSPDVPYRYLISYTAPGVGGVPLYGHFHLQRSHPFTSDVLGDVMRYIKTEAGLARDPVITGVFTFADSADAVQARQSQSTAGVAE